MRTEEELMTLRFGNDFLQKSRLHAIRKLMKLIDTADVAPAQRWLQAKSQGNKSGKAENSLTAPIINSVSENAAWTDRNPCTALLKRSSVSQVVGRKPFFVSQKIISRYKTSPNCSTRAMHTLKIIGKLRFCGRANGEQALLKQFFLANGRRRNRLFWSERAIPENTLKQCWTPFLLRRLFPRITSLV